MKQPWCDWINRTEELVDFADRYECQSQNIVHRHCRIATVTPKAPNPIFIDRVRQPNAAELAWAKQAAAEKGLIAQTLTLKEGHGG